MGAFWKCFSHLRSDPYSFAEQVLMVREHPATHLATFGYGSVLSLKKIFCCVYCKLQNAKKYKKNKAMEKLRPLYIIKQINIFKS